MNDQTVLRNFWERSMSTAAKAVSPAEWQDLEYALSLHGRGIFETLSYLYRERPPLDGFLDWMLAGRVPQATSPAIDTLTTEDLAFWDKNGYIVVPNAATEAQCHAVRDAIWSYIDADPTDPDTWYAAHPGKNGMMLNLFQHPALDEIRNSPRIRRAFEQLYGSSEIYQHIDKAGFNPPETPRYRFQGSGVHWDVSLELPIPDEFQGVLYISDVAEDGGCFHCVPGFHKCIGEWLGSLAPGVDARQAAATALELKAISGNAGDLVIWHQALPHCATPNRGQSPRLVQYVSYKPVKRARAAAWK